MTVLSLPRLSTFPNSPISTSYRSCPLHIPAGGLETTLPVCAAPPIREARGWTTAGRGAAGSSPGCLITGEGEKSPSQDIQETKAELRLDPGLPPPSLQGGHSEASRGSSGQWKTPCLGIHVHCRFTAMLKSCLVKATIFHLKIQISTCSLKTTSSGKQRPTSP